MTMSWTISEVVRLSGVTSRTLRHYDAIGLLKPESTEFDGRRIYGREDLLRLQEILLLRDLGLPLKSIGEILDSRDPAGSRAEVLRGHRQWLIQERARLDRLIETVNQTIERGDEMNAEMMFEGFAANPYESEARQRWGDQAIDDSKERLKRLTPEDAERLRTGFTEIHGRLAELRDGAVPVEDERVQDAIADHHAIVSLTWEPNREAYINLGEMYVEDDRFRESIGDGDDELVEYLRDAMRVYAEERLG